MTATEQIEHIYGDQTVEIYDTHIKILKYYFPLATSKTIFYGQIDRIIYNPNQQVNTLWGTTPHHLNNWFPLDANRKKKNCYFQIVLKDKAIRPSFSPSDPERAFKILWQNHTKDGKTYRHLVQTRNQQIIDQAIEMQNGLKQRHNSKIAQGQNCQQNPSFASYISAMPQNTHQTDADIANKQNKPLL